MTEKPHKITAWAEYQETKVSAEVLRQLLDLGYEVTERTFYRHCKSGKCPKNEQGVYSRRMVKSGYVEAVPILRKGSPGEEPEANTALSVEKQRLENDKLILHNRREKNKADKEDGLLIERQGLYLELAARTVTLDNSFIQAMDLEGPAIIAAVGGDVSRMPEYMALVTTIWNELLNKFSTTDEFEVLFEMDDEEEADEKEM